MMDYHEMAARVLRRRDDYVLEQKRRRRALPALACLCLAALVGVGAWQAGLPSHSQDGGGTTDPTRDGVPDQYSSLDGAPHAYAEESGPWQEAQDPASLPAHSGDVPAQEPYQETRPTPASLEALWGGSYWDNGHTVVLLTQDSPENRALVLQARPDLDASSVVFQPAAHSLAYLTGLQERITQGMMDGKLPYVSTSSLMEAENLLRVTVTTQDEDRLHPLRRFDPTGTALDIRYAGAAQDLLG